MARSATSSRDIKEGHIPQVAKKPAKLRQKDRDARY
jgi:hypothetical protein